MTVPPIAILLATYNGERFLDEQLASIRDQTYDRIDIVVSDDGSVDGTRAILSRWVNAWHKGTITLIEGPQRGFSENFRALIKAAPNGYAAYCFADQDDIWLADKVTRGLQATGGGGSEPVLYGSRTQLVNEAGIPIGRSPLFARPKSFRNALVQSMAGGNTMMLNPAAFALLVESARRTGFATHDWWAYMLITGAGGTAKYDPEPTLLYRQHAGNVVGKNSGMAASFRRFRGVIRGQFKDWAEANIAALEACSDMLTPEAQVTLSKWKYAHNARPPFGLAPLLGSRVYRQNLRGNVTLYLAAIMGWV